MIDREVIAGHITICQCDRTLGAVIIYTARTIRRGNGDALQCEVCRPTIYIYGTNVTAGQIAVCHSGCYVIANDDCTLIFGSNCITAKIQCNVFVNPNVAVCGYIRQQLHSVARLGLSEGTRKGIILLTIDFGHFSRVRREGSHGHKAHRQNADKQADEPFFSSHYESITSINVSKFD